MSKRRRALGTAAAAGLAALAAWLVTRPRGDGRVLPSGAPDQLGYAPPSASPRPSPPVDEASDPVALPVVPTTGPGPWDPAVQNGGPVVEAELTPEQEAEIEAARQLRYLKCAATGFTSSIWCPEFW